MFKSIDKELHAYGEAELPQHVASRLSRTPLNERRHTPGLDGCRRCLAPDPAIHADEAVGESARPSASPRPSRLRRALGWPTMP